MLPLFVGRPSGRKLKRFRGDEQGTSNHQNEKDLESELTIRLSRTLPIRERRPVCVCFDLASRTMRCGLSVGRLRTNEHRQLGGERTLISRLLQSAERNKANVVRLAHFFQRPANSHVTRESRAAIGRVSESGRFKQANWRSLIRCGNFRVVCSCKSENKGNLERQYCNRATDFKSDNLTEDSEGALYEPDRAWEQRRSRPCST